MNSLDLLADAFGRALDDVRRAVDGLGPDELNHRPDADANPIAWLVWHLARVQDDHVADLAGTEQAWTTDGWARRFDLPFDDAAMGYGQSSSDVGKVRVESPELLLGYLGAVHERTLAYLRTLSDDDLDVVVDDAWDPPVTRGARLVSVVDDDIQHAGQAAYVAGLVRRW